MNLNDFINAPKEGKVNGSPALIWYLEYAPLPAESRLYRFLDGSIKIRDLTLAGCAQVSEPVWRPLGPEMRVEVNEDFGDFA